MKVFKFCLPKPQWVEQKTEKINMNMPKHLEYVAHALSHCSEEASKSFKAKDEKAYKYWTDIHRILTHACRDIGIRNYKEIK